MQTTIPPTSPIPNPPSRSRAAHGWQAGLSLLGSAVLLVFALVYAWRGLGSISNSQISRDEVTGSFLMAASVALCGLLLLPSAGYALARLAGLTTKPSTGRRRIEPLIIIFLLSAAFILLLFAGKVISGRIPLTWIVLPFIHVLAIVIPVAMVLYLGGRGLPKGSPQRAWGVFAAGMVIGPVLAFTLEIIVLVMIVLAVVVLIALSPSQYQELSHLVEQLRSINQSPEGILPTLQPYLRNPIVAFSVLFFMAGVSPVLEEAVKPAGVWLLLKRRLTPVEGFTAGLISGAGFALVESLGYASNGGSSWAPSVLMRAPTALMHILACGLTGWGIAKAASLRQTRWLLAGYGGAVAIHALWNGFTVTAAGIVLMYPNQPAAVAVAGLALLGLLTVFGLVFLLLTAINHRLRQQAAHAIIYPPPALVSAPVTIPPESESSLHAYHP